MDRSIALIAASLMLAASSGKAAAEDSGCMVDATLAAYSFIAGRALTPPESAAISAEARRHAGEASPNDCASLRAIRKGMASGDPVLLARRRVDVHAAMWFALSPGDARRVLMQRLAPVSFDDPKRKLVVRRHALEAYLASARFVGKQFGITTPADSPDDDRDKNRAAFRAAPRDVASLIMYQEAYWAALRRSWPTKSAAWRRQALGPKPAGLKGLQERTMKVQLAVVPRPARRAAASGTLARYNAAMNRGLVSSAMLSAMSAGRP